MLERVGPGTPGDHPALVGGVEQHPRPDRIRDLPHGCNRMFVQVEASAQGDQRRLLRQRQCPQALDIDAVTVGFYRRFENTQAKQARAARPMVGDVSTDRCWRDNDRVPWLTDRHEAIEVGQRARRHTDFGKPRIEDLGAELGGDDFDFFDRLQPHFVLVARVPQRRP
ncbi:MAG: Uncharacterised protein [Rhodospirillaceae bacterium]|nr:MAG: Uncharacterised protein [Rhodospirillaceae bacterium]